MEEVQRAIAVHKTMLMARQMGMIGFTDHISNQINNPPKKSEPQRRHPPQNGR